MTSSFEVQHVVSAISQEHEMLGNKVAALSGMLARETANLPKITDLLQDIAEAATRHFITEEDLMERLEYPWLPTHRMNHEWFKRFMTEYLEGVTKGDIRINDDARRNLPNLIRFYMTCRDQEFEAWLSEKPGRHRGPARSQ